MISTLDKQIETYKKEHKGETPLYILVSSFEADQLLEEVRKAGGYTPEVIVTTYKGSKIVKHDSLKGGELILSNELPEASG